MTTLRGSFFHVLIAFLVHGYSGHAAASAQEDATPFRPVETLSNPESTRTFETDTKAPGGTEVKGSDSSSGDKDADATLRSTFWNHLNAIARLSKNGTLLVQIRAYRDLETDFASKDADLSETVASFLSWKLSAAGRYAEALDAFDRGSPMDELPSPEALASQLASLEGLQERDAIEAIGKASRGVQALFVNEAHHVPQHRALTLRLLPVLRRMGFTHFAAETLNQWDTAKLSIRGYPTQSSGTYLDEPVYADLVRTALGLGFRVVAYESIGAGDREQGQARNLVERVFATDPGAKLVVHLGYGHNFESASARKGKGAMAYHFRRMTGIDPLTIDQTQLSEHSDPRFEHPLYVQLAESRHFRAAVVFENDRGALWHLPGTDRDITVVHPRSVYRSGRPTWLELGGTRHVTELTADICGSLDRCLVQARHSHESEGAVPIDRVIVRDGEDAPALMLPAGSFQISVWDQNGERRRSLKLSVPGDATDGAAPTPSPASSD